MTDERTRPWVIELDLARLAPGESTPWSALRRSYADSERLHGADSERLRGADAERGRGADRELEFEVDPACGFDLGRLGRGSGEALALVELWRRRDEPFVLAVGECVRRGVPTAARTSVVARSPLSGLVADGQVGSDLARRLASVGDAFVLSGRAEGNVLVLDADGARVVRDDQLAGAEPRGVHARLEARWGPCATLSVGLAGERGVRIANLAACSSGTGAAAVAHYVGRGGLGAAFAAHGLKALAVLAPAVATSADEELVRWLLASPRLAARAAGGTFELTESLALRGDLFARGGSVAVTREEARRFNASIEASARSAHGCRGCPTPCGVVLEGARGERRGARFSAGHALGLDLGLERGEDALALLAACDRIGVDAKELGAGLALVARARANGTLAEGPRFGERDALLASVEAVVESSGLGALLARGSAAVARELGLDAAVARGQAVRREQSRASLLGQCVAARGPDPMRTFPFLAADAGSRARLVRLVAPLELPPGAENPESCAGKGRLVWWHENLAAALDASGFCAFSAGALLADGTVTLDELASAIAPRAWLAEGSDSAGWRLLDGGAQLVALVRALERRFAAPAELGGLDQPEFARAALAEPGMLDEYRALRAIGPALCATAVERARGLPCELRAPVAAPESGPVALGRVLVVAGGEFGRSYGTECELELQLPCDVANVLRALQQRRPDGPALFAGAIPVPTVFRAGRRLEPDVAVHAGDRLELVVAISGG